MEVRSNNRYLVLLYKRRGELQKVFRGQRRKPMRADRNEVRSGGRKVGQDDQDLQGVSVGTGHRQEDRRSGWAGTDDDVQVLGRSRRPALLVPQDHDSSGWNDRET